MGLLDFGAVADSGVKGPYADYDAAITALRSDVTASDGDLYQLDNDMTFNAFVSEGPGILIPSDLYDRVSGYVDNASGDAYFISADTEAEIVARGWVIVENNNGTVSGGNGSPFRCDSGTSAGGAADTGAIQFTPSSSQSSIIQIVKLDTAGTAIRPEQSYACSHYDGSRVLRVVSTAGSVGAFGIYSSLNTLLSAAVGAFTEASTGWFIMYSDRTTSTNVVSVRRLEDKPEEAVSAEVGDLPSSTFGAVTYLGAVLASTGNQSILDFYEAHVVATT